MAIIPPDVITAAKAANAKWQKVPVSVTIAQWILESGWGVHTPAGSNNPFGIKARAGEPYVTSWTWEFEQGSYHRVEQRFRTFTTLAEAFTAHAALLGSAPVYARARSMPTAEAFAHALTGVYATDQDYGSKLIDIMHDNNLSRYDVVTSDANMD